MNNAATTITTTTCMTYAEAEADALRAYEASNGLVIGGTYIVRAPNGTVGWCDLRVVDGAVRLYDGRAFA